MSCCVVVLGVWGIFGITFRWFWVPLGSILASFWALWAPLGVLLSLLGPRAGPSRRLTQQEPFAYALGKIGNLVNADVCIFTARSAFLEHAAEVTEVTEMVSRMLARSPPSTHAGGQDDGSYTNSLELLSITSDQIILSYVTL